MMTFMGNVLLCVALTLICYFFGLTLYRKYKKGWLHPLYTASVFLIIFLLGFHINVDTYQQGSFVFNQLLQLAVVSLAVPLYKQWNLLKRNYKKICVGVICGTAMGVLAVSVLAQIFQLEEQMIASLIPRSVTLPVALTVSSDLGGLTSTTVFYVLMSAFISLIIGPKLLRQFGIKSKSARGVAMGISAQMLGVNRSLVWGEEEGAMGSIAMTTSALFLSISVPLLLLLF
ncbi:LrgB family protein [Alkalihalobacillus sp. BA299]|uniref:LrgB family protein n=1 Tax=Alkalihalobacillus sp. BA299 TaxID=2815938 RepID=UPI001ADA653B|nr:LrgB family protein [Alkalihalobacillus sp. BA299]